MSTDNDNDPDVGQRDVNRKKTLVRSNALCGDDDTRLKSPVRLVNSQTKPALSSSLSKDSTGYTDVTGIDLYSFIRDTLHKNPKDREHLLQLEETLFNFMSDKNAQAHQFPKMTSYDRMIVHRVSAFFGLDHNVTQDGQSVVVTKTDYATFPPFKFRNLIEHDNFTEKMRNGRSTSVRSNQTNFSTGRHFLNQDNYGITDLCSSTGSLTLDEKRTRSVDYPTVMPSSGPYIQNMAQLPYLSTSMVLPPTSVGRRTRNVTVTGMAPPDPTPNEEVTLADNQANWKSSSTVGSADVFTPNDPLKFDSLASTLKSPAVPGCLSSSLSSSYGAAVYPYIPYMGSYASWTNSQGSIIYAQPNAPAQVYTPSGPQTFYAPFYN